jgi:hypothetical protein
MVKLMIPGLAMAHAIILDGDGMDLPRSGRGVAMSNCLEFP